MTDKQLETKIEQAFSHATPNVLDNILSECDSVKGTVTNMTTSNVYEMNNYKKVSPMRKIIPAVASLAIVGAVGVYAFMAISANNVVSTVSIDVNPAIEIDLNKDNKVVEVKSVNSDAASIIDDMNFEGSDLNVAVSSLMGAMYTDGYLNDQANSILISVESDDTTVSDTIESTVTGQVQEFFEGTTFAGSIISQNVTASESVENLANTFGITTGKAQLIEKLIASNPAYTAEQLAALGINDLNLLINSTKNEVEDTEVTGTPSETGFIGENEALIAALAELGLTEADIADLEIEMDVEDGKMVYEVEFKNSNNDYDFDIDATTGTIVKNTVETNDDLDDDTDDMDDDQDDLDDDNDDLDDDADDMDDDNDDLDDDADDMDDDNDDLDDDNDDYDDVSDDNDDNDDDYNEVDDDNDDYDDDNDDEYEAPEVDYDDDNDDDYEVEYEDDSDDDDGDDD